MKKKDVIKHMMIGHCYTPPKRFKSNKKDILKHGTLINVIDDPWIKILGERKNGL